MKALTERYPTGSRVRLVRWGPSEVIDDHENVPSGTRGVVTGTTEGYGIAQVQVAWENGSRLSPCLPEDIIERIE